MAGDGGLLSPRALPSSMSQSRCPSGLLQLSAAARIASLPLSEQGQPLGVAATSASFWICCHVTPGAHMSLQLALAATALKSHCQPNRASVS